jgi:hypothetical protein
MTKSSGLTEAQHNTHIMEYHEIASIFPLLGIQEIGAIAEDIKKNGLLNPILTYEGKILDGRNRFRACSIAGVSPVFTEYEGNDPVGHVYSLNLHRRQLTQSQKAAFATEGLPYFAEEAKKRMEQGANQHSPVELVPHPSNGIKSRDQAGELVGVNGRYVSEAKRIKEASPETFERIKSGEISIKAAAKEVFRDKPEALTIELKQDPSADLPPSESMSIAKRIGILINTISPSDRMASEAVDFIQGRLEAKRKAIKTQN